MYTIQKRRRCVDLRWPYTLQFLQHPICSCVHPPCLQVDGDGDNDGYSAGSGGATVVRAGLSSALKRYVIMLAHATRSILCRDYKSTAQM